MNDYSWQAADDEIAFVGPTMLSQLVCGKAYEIKDKFDDLLRRDALLDYDRFARAYYAVEDKHKKQAIELAVAASLQAAASWDFRFVTPVSAFPLLLLWFVEKPCDQPDHKRQSVATLLLDASGESLVGRHSDVALKIRNRFKGEIKIVKESGTCPLPLYSAVLLIRSSMHGDTQDLEGDNSILQVMTSRARRMRIALASARMQLKRGQQLTAATCSAMHHQVLAYHNTEQNAARFNPVIVYEDKLPKLPPPAEEPEVPASEAKACCRAYAIFRMITVGAKYVYTFGPLHFLCCWTYFSKIYIAPGSLNGDIFSAISCAAAISA